MTGKNTIVMRDEKNKIYILDVSRVIELLETENVNALGLSHAAILALKNWQIFGGGDILDVAEIYARPRKRIKIKNKSKGNRGVQHV